MEHIGKKQKYDILLWLLKMLMSLLKAVYMCYFSKSIEHIGKKQKYDILLWLKMSMLFQRNKHTFNSFWLDKNANICMECFLKSFKYKNIKFYNLCTIYSKNCFETG